MRLNQLQNLIFAIHSGVGVYTDVQVFKYAERLFYDSISEYLLRGEAQGLSCLIAATRALGFVSCIVYDRSQIIPQSKQDCKSVKYQNSSVTQIKNIQVGAIDSEGFTKTIYVPMTNGTVEMVELDILSKLLDEKKNNFMSNINVMAALNISHFQYHFSIQQDVENYFKQFNATQHLNLFPTDSYVHNSNHIYDTLGIVVQSSSYKCSIAMTRGGDGSRLSPAVIPDIGLQLNSCISGDGDAYQRYKCLNNTIRDRKIATIKKRLQIAKQQKAKAILKFCCIKKMFRYYKIAQKYNYAWTKLEIINNLVKISACPTGGFSFLISICQDIFDSINVSQVFYVNKDGQYIIKYNQSNKQININEQL